jgi:hypothetical protein
MGFAAMRRFLFTQTSEPSAGLHFVDPGEAANAEPEGFVEDIKIIKRRGHRGVIEVRDATGRRRAFVSYPQN